MKVNRDYAAQIKTLEVIHERRRALTPMVKCFHCGVLFKRSRSAVRERNYCSRVCSNKGTGEYISAALKGRIISENTKEKLRKYTGEMTSNWKGGKPTCKMCGVLIGYNSQYCQKHKQALWSAEKWASAWDGSRKKLVGRIPKNIASTPGKFGNVRRDWYEINGIKMFFRSKWEVNYALYLDFLVKQNLIEKWEYEPDVFVFDKIQFGTRSYRPDFKITNKDNTIEYHEIKGWLTPKSITQLKRMERYYPSVRLRLIAQREYIEICKKLGGLLCFY